MFLRSSYNQECDEDASGFYVVSLMSGSKMTNPQQDVICEIPYQHIGDRGGRCYFTLSDKTMAFLKQVKEGDVNPLTVFLAQEKKPLKDGKESKQSKEGKDGLEAVKNTENVGFSIMDFPKGQVGQRNLQAFFRQLPGVYEKRGIKLLKEDATIRVNKKLHTWAPLTVQCALFFDLMESSSDKKGHSRAVFYRVEQFIPSGKVNAEGRDTGHMALLSFLLQVTQVVPANLLSD